MPVSDVVNFVNDYLRGGDVKICVGGTCACVGVGEDCFYVVRNGKKFCAYCKHELVEDKSQYDEFDLVSLYCDGVQSMRVSPFAVNVYNDHTLRLMCDGSEYEDAMDI